ncbi:hypothetical protein [Methanococcoides burtonii]|uniref:hypothetical protein n=1 Tax=Methanococcoides burtonii TaxID=29291 RepID=UPI00003996B3|nr:hypothetical protein [Methanococcoides burtonii]
MDWIYQLQETLRINEEWVQVIYSKIGTLPNSSRLWKANNDHIQCQKGLETIEKVQLGEDVGIIRYTIKIFPGNPG